METKHLTIHITSRDKVLAFDNISLADWQTVVDSGKWLLCDENTAAHEVYMRPEPGSLKAIFSASAAAVYEAGAFLSAVNAGQALDGLPPAKVKAVRLLQAMATDEHCIIDIEAQDYSGGNLRLEAEAPSQPPEVEWYMDEICIYGKVIDAGGSARPNIHLQTENAGRVTIAVARELLEKEEKNLLYRWIGVQTALRRRLIDHSWDLSSLKAIKLLPYEPSWKTGEIEALALRLAKTWHGVNADQWLAEVRGR